ncbi:hypothetical protein EMIHUDRAFT_120477 [Emiliania huxleyi CCMP1516]|uniref:AP2/ERF domain-containing protein n=2 Tax=Emiliania huxleyi TaxID=2903 RepID=A0A0D3IHS3_EMIH1|nr:hypothetical protein EMIHUDRAFT_120477 [Emiliania huxleyi CCMP1516]EOD10808.1 hypothetical protein EMIHUDRAFT_120477 [Emiliania huxleyi CCMP1516]|eukprot:XP_005763237.1 hypothetical protein EMIHUDRAFT_120477 [Emiliania huxleyi CCMP1516]
MSTPWYQQKRQKQRTQPEPPEPLDANSGSDTELQADDSDEGAAASLILIGALTTSSDTSAEPSRRSYTLLGERVLIPAILKNSTTGYKCVSFSHQYKKFKAHARVGGKQVHLGYFDTAEEAASAYARSAYGRADAAKLLQPRSAPTAAGAEAIRQAEREGLTLATSSNNSTGYKGVSFCPKGSKKYKLAVRVGGKQATIGRFTTAEQAALFHARREAGRDMVALYPQETPPPPPPPPPPAPSSAAGAEAVRQAEREGLTLATSSNNSTGYKGVSFTPKQQGSKKYMLKVRVGGKKVTLGRFATAEQAALFYARREAGRDTSDLTAPPPPPPPPAPSSAAGAELG